MFPKVRDATRSLSADRVRAGAGPTACDRCQRHATPTIVEEHRDVAVTPRDRQRFCRAPAPRHGVVRLGRSKDPHFPRPFVGDSVLRDELGPLHPVPASNSGRGRSERRGQCGRPRPASVAPPSALPFRVFDRGNSVNRLSPAGAGRCVAMRRRRLPLSRSRSPPYARHQSRNCYGRGGRSAYNGVIVFCAGVLDCAGGSWSWRPQAIQPRRCEGSARRWRSASCREDRQEHRGHVCKTRHNRRV